MPSELENLRRQYPISLPKAMQKLSSLSLEEMEPSSPKGNMVEIQDEFPNTYGQCYLSIGESKGTPSEPLKVGVLFSGGQAPGGHNVLAGLYDGIKEIHKDSILLGFIGGPLGLIENKSMELSKEKIDSYRNMGGFDLIGSGRTKIETEQQFKDAFHTVQIEDLDGLVIVGGDDSNTNAAFLAEYLKKKNSFCSVVGVPKTIDGDLRNENVAISFGFDTACRTYAEMIGNIQKDALSAKKYYHFIRVMGRSASHIALECALHVQPNMVLISEEIEKNGTSLQEIVQEIADMVERRAKENKKYGVILIPEGIIESIPDCKKLILHLNRLLGEKGAIAEKFIDFSEKEKRETVKRSLSPEMSELFSSLPEFMQNQLLIDRDPHGNVQVSKIDSEKLLLAMTQKELENRPGFSGKFQGLTHFFGYEGRSAMPTNFDARYCYALGAFAALLVKEKRNGYMAAITSLEKEPIHWEGKGVPLTSLLDIEERKGKRKIVIKKSLVDLNGKLFRYLASKRALWAIKDDYLSPGPIQFSGEKELVDRPPMIVDFHR